MTIHRRAILLSTVATATAGWPQLGTAQLAASLNDFMALSARLTGFPATALSADVGALMLQAFQDRGVLLPKDLAPDATLSPTLSAQIIAAWYSGIVKTAAGSEVLTHSEALIWQSAEFLHPPGQCGGAFGYWTHPPVNA